MSKKYTLKSLDSLIENSYSIFSETLEIDFFPNQPVSKITILDNSGEIILVQPVVDYLDYSEEIYSLFGNFTISKDSLNISGKSGNYSLDIFLEVNSDTVYNSLPTELKNKLDYRTWTQFFFNPDSKNPLKLDLL